MLEAIKSFLFRNKDARQTVVKNTVWLSISNFGGRLIKAAVIIYGARALGTAGYGVFSYAVTLAGFFTLFVDPGINAYLMREGAKASDEERHIIFSTTFFIKIALIVAGALVVIFIAPFFSTLPGAQALLPLVALIIIFDSIREFLSSLIRAREKMEWEAAIFLLANLAIVIFGFIFLRISATPLWFMWGYVAGAAVGAVGAIIALRNYFHKIYYYFSANLVPRIIRVSWPFAVTGALGALLTNTDILVISWMKTASEVGIYSAAIRIIQVLYLVPMIVQFSTLPVLSRLAQSSREKFREALEQSISFIFLASIPLAIGGALLGTRIMEFVFGAAYAPGGLPFKILMVALLFDFPTAIVSTAVFAYNHQKSLIVTSAIGGIANVLFDLLFIPHFGMTGSAVATLCAQALSNTYLWYMMKKINHFEVLPRLAKIIPAGIVMAAATAIFSVTGMNLLLNIVLSCAIYFAVLFALREELIVQIKNILGVAKAG